jgi:hypothetical protein
MKPIFSFLISAIEKVLDPIPEADADFNFRTYCIRASELVPSDDEDDDYRSLEIFECTIPAPNNKVVIQATEVHYNAQSLIKHWLHQNGNATSPAGKWLQENYAHYEQSRKFWQLKHRLQLYLMAKEKMRIAKIEKATAFKHLIEALKDLY